MENVVEPSVENLLLELKKRAKNELVTDTDAFKTLVDDLLDEKIEWGEIERDEDTEMIREDLISRWPEVKEYLERKGEARPPHIPSDIK